MVGMMRKTDLPGFFTAAVTGVRGTLIRVSVMALTCVGGTATADPDEIVVLGDSILDWLYDSGDSISERLEDALDVPVDHRAIGGAVFHGHSLFDRLTGRDIRGQFPGGTWGAVVLDGGGNDLMQRCGCMACESELDALISEDGQDGSMPDFLLRLRDHTAHVYWLGYYQLPAAGGPFAECREELDHLDIRLRDAAASMDWVTYVSGRDVYDPEDASLYDPDLLHPSAKGAARLADHLADAIRQDIRTVQ